MNLTPTPLLQSTKLPPQPTSPHASRFSACRRIKRHFVEARAIFSEHHNNIDACAVHRLLGAVDPDRGRPVRAFRPGSLTSDAEHRLSVPDRALLGNAALRSLF